MYRDASDYAGYKESFDAVVGNDDFIIYGGRNAGNPALSILARMDLSTNNRRWAKTFDVKGNDGRRIWALALNPSSDKIAVHAFKEEDA